MRAPGPAGRPLLHREEGFTLIEMMVAALVLIVGLTGTFAMIRNANAADASARGREGATNLAREVLEDARTRPYGQLDDDALTSTVLHNEGVLPLLDGYQGISGNTARVKQRDFVYKVTASVCTVDDPKDGVGDHLVHTPQFCLDNPSTPSPATDSQPDDLRRVTVKVTWTGSRAGSVTVTEAAMFSSAGEVIGLPVQSVVMAAPAWGGDPNAPVISSDPPGTTTPYTCAAGSACFTATANGAQRINFSIEGNPVSGGVTADPSCTAGAACSTWRFTWPLSGVGDGLYRISARAVDPFGVVGPPQSVLVRIARGKPAAPCGVGSASSTCLPIAAGYNRVKSGGSWLSPVVELQWQANTERSVTGYEVDRPDGSVACKTTTQDADPYSCIDFTPPAPSTASVTYQVKALYTNASGSPAAGSPTLVTFSGGAAMGSSSTHYGFNSTQSQATSVYPCSALNPTPTLRDLTPSFTGGTEVSWGKANGASIAFCTSPFNPLNADGTRIPAGSVPITAFFDNSAAGSTSSCTVTYALLRTGSSTPIASGTAAVPSGGNNSTSLLALNANLTVPATTLGLGEQVVVRFTLGATNCSSTLLYYAGTGTSSLSPLRTADPNQPGSLDLTTQPFYSTTWPKPQPPTGVTATAGAGVTKVSWNPATPAPNGGKIGFYRIYRDGQDYGTAPADRYRLDVCTPGDSDCDNGTSFTYTDYNTGGTSHTYYVTAVGAATVTSNGVSYVVPTMAESGFSAGATG